MSLAPALLLSMPQLLDPNFARTVVLLCEHAAEGAFGLVVNRPSDIRAAEAVVARAGDRIAQRAAAAHRRARRAASRLDSDGGAAGRSRASRAWRRSVSVGVSRAAAPRADGVAAAVAHAGARRLRRLGTRPARSGTRAVVVAHHSRRARSDLRHSRRRRAGKRPSAASAQTPTCCTWGRECIRELEVTRVLRLPRLAYLICQVPVPASPLPC